MRPRATDSYSLCYGFYMSKQDWYLEKPEHEQRGQRSLEVLRRSLNEKYGRYDYSHDLRAHDNGQEFGVALRQAASDVIEQLSLEDKPSILLAGSNSGYEVPLLHDFGEIIAVDLSDVALDELKEKHPGKEAHVQDIEAMSFADNSFDVYISMRTLQSSNLDLKSALDEAMRVTRHAWIISISNGYLVNDEVIKGMYDYDKQEISEDLAQDYVRRITDYFNKHKAKVTTKEVTSEIIIAATIT